MENHFSSANIRVLYVLQPLSRMGADVTGVDAVEKNIGVASVHAVYPWIPLEKHSRLYLVYPNRIASILGHKSMIIVCQVMKLKGVGHYF